MPGVGSLRRVYQRACFWVFFFTIIITPLPAVAESAEFYTHPLPPFSIVEQGQVKGLAVDIVHALMDITEQQAEIKVVPFKRGLFNVQENQVRAFFIVARRPDREDTVKWVGPLLTSGVYFYKKKGNPIEPRSIEDMKSLKAIGVAFSNADHTYLRDQGFTNLVTSYEQQKSLELLFHERIDVSPMSELVMPMMAREVGIAPQEFENTGVKLYDSPVYLVFSLNTPDATIEQWQQALDSLHRTGRYEEIYRNYVN